MSVVVPDAVAERVHKWLGDIPAGWSGARLFEVADAWTSNVDKHTVEGQPSVRLCNYVDVYKNDSIVDSLDFMAASATHDQIRKFRIRQGDTLITKDSETADDIGVPAFVEYEAEDLVCGYHLAIIRPHGRKVVPRFLYWALDSEPIARQWSVTAAGVTRVGIRSTDLNKVTIPLPPPDEQRAIADYLDHETAQIDVLVAKQEEFVGLLQERRGAVRDKLMTAGVVQGRSVEATGSAWLSELPRGWRAVPTRRLLELGPSNGVSPEAGRVGDLRSLSIGAVRNGRVRLADDVTKYVDRAAVSDISRLRLEPGDVLIVRGNGNISLVGRAGLVGDEFGQQEYIYPDLLIRIRTTPDMLPEFFVAAFDAPASRAQIELLARTTVGTFKVSAADVKSIVLPRPPIDEQHAIVEHINEQTTRIDALIAKAEEHIVLAKERRSALVTAAVTGQIDVRTARKAS
ncbi:restriction endonuclease subunit S [Georgenia sp. SYP-B2076]|uniref:restriction endonuclease subunit S n=1 Tax=Georgenia sp. SYP-B2076 TaxID=2495881 RepID=UPI000F8F3388|nr:restriction endonuclease subunit S [Georgenia sp. SYP-B2076]